MQDIHWADFVTSYEQGLEDLLLSIAYSESEQSVRKPVKKTKAPSESESDQIIKPTFDNININTEGDVISIKNQSDTTVNKSNNEKQLEPMVNQLRRDPLVVSTDEFIKVFKLNQGQQSLKYVKNKYEDQGNVIIDHATGLMWEKAGSDNQLFFKSAQSYIKKRNQKQFEGYPDWRLPTIDELLSLLEPKQQSNALYIDMVFSSKQRYCWSADTVKDSAGSAWSLFFSNGRVYPNDPSIYYYVRAVRSVNAGEYAIFSKEQATDTVNHVQKVKESPLFHDQPAQEPEKKQPNKTKKSWITALLLIIFFVFLSILFWKEPITKPPVEGPITKPPVEGPITKPPVEEPLLVNKKSEPKVQLRRDPLKVSDEYKKIFELDSDQRPLKYVENKYEDQGDVIVDHATGLMWQKAGSNNYMSFKNAQVYIADLNSKSFAGYSNWRLPTIDELKSLLEPEKQSNNLFIDSMFNSEQKWCWSADTVKDSAGSAWLVLFSDGESFRLFSVNDLFYVRAVRSVK